MSNVKGFCKDLKCANAQDLDELCPEHKAEYEAHLDDMAARADMQERYERDGEQAS